MADRELDVIGIMDGPERGVLVVCLSERGGRRRHGYLTAGEEAAASITFAARRIRTDPPQVYDAWMDMLGKAGITLEQFIINAFVGGGAERRVAGILCLSGGASWKFTVPCGAAEGINLALRAGAPVRCAEEVLDIMDEQANAMPVGTEREWREEFPGVDPPLPKN